MNYKLKTKTIMAEEIKRKRGPKRQKSTPDVEQLQSIEDQNEQVSEEVTTQEKKPEIPDKKTKIIKKDLPPKEEIKKVVSPSRKVHRVFVRGKERYLTPSVIKAVSKDPTLKLQIPEDTDFELPHVRKCKDC